MGDSKMRRRPILALLSVLIIFSCAKDPLPPKDKNSAMARRGFFYPILSSKWLPFTQESKQESTYYHGLHTCRYEWVKTALAGGSDPNYCQGEEGWAEENPLYVLAATYLGTYERFINHKEKIPKLTADIAILNELLKYGADIHRRPYVWYRTICAGNDELETIMRIRKDNNESIDPKNKDMQEEINDYIGDMNRLLEAFIKAGADVDMPGKVFESKSMYDRMTDKKAKKYFEGGSRAINVAIEKGIVWESQVDLLLKYTTLDEESLRAAERSKDPKMIEKINKLWAKQTGGR
jgi:hypothetical protein